MTQDIDKTLKEMGKVYIAAAEELTLVAEDSSLNPDEKFDKMVSILTRIGAIT